MPDTQYGEIYKTANRFREEVLRQERTASAEMVRVYGATWQRIKAEIDLFNKRRQERLDKGEKVSDWQLLRLKDLQKQVEREISAFEKFAEEKITAQQREVIDLASRHTEYLVRTALGKLPNGYGVSWNRVPKEALEDLVGFLQDGSPLRDLFNSYEATGQEAMDILTQGLALGLNPRVIASQMRKALGDDMVRALRIARTEVLRSYRESSRRGYEANNNIVKGWIWNAACNERTCASCWSKHGSFHTLDEQLLDHICGRCSMLPVTKSWEEMGFIGIRDTSPKIPSGEELFNKLSDVEKLAVLGPAKYAAYKEKAITLADLSKFKPDDKWGGMWYEPSLKEVVGAELAKKYGTLARLTKQASKTIDIARANIGSTQKRGDYTAGELIRVAIAGTRELTEDEIEKVVQHVAGAGFSPRQNVKLPKKYDGWSVDGTVYRQGDMVDNGIMHYLKHVVEGKEWPEITTYDAYLKDLKRIINQGDILLNRYPGSEWQFSFIGDAEISKGLTDYDKIVVNYRVSQDYWMTGYHLRKTVEESIEKLLDQKWVKKKL